MLVTAIYGNRLTTDKQNAHPLKDTASEITFDHLLQQNATTLPVHASLPPFEPCISANRVRFLHWRIRGLLRRRLSFPLRESHFFNHGHLLSKSPQEIF